MPNKKRDYTAIINKLSIFGIFLVVGYLLGSTYGKVYIGSILGGLIGTLASIQISYHSENKGDSDIWTEKGDIVIIYTKNTDDKLIKKILKK